VIPPGAGTTYDFLGITHKLTSRETGGAFYLFESSFGPGDSNRLHVHRREDEISYVLEGALEIRLRDETMTLEAGGVARLPKNLPHAIRNPLPTPSRYLFLAIPGGLDQWFDAVEQARRDGLLDDATFQELSRDRELEWLE
jgi:quercetin dioxygenase-like cupin family protein